MLQLRMNDRKSGHVLAPALLRLLRCDEQKLLTLISRVIMRADLYKCRDILVKLKIGRIILATYMFFYTARSKI